MHKNILFDVDGTLLPMDMDVFIKLYFGSLCKRFSPILGIEPDVLTKAVWKGTSAMIHNDGSVSNREAFWEVASKACGVDLAPYEKDFDNYYENEFIAAKQATSLNPYAQKCVELAKSKGYKLIAATNPIFPEVATRRRLEWAGLNPEDFEYVTTYENSSFAKPNLKYYQEICEKCSINPEESVMVGNDVDEDMCVSQLGFDTYLITDCLINRESKDLSLIKNGTFEDFYNYLLTI